MAEDMPPTAIIAGCFDKGIEISKDVSARPRHGFFPSGTKTHFEACFVHDLPDSGGDLAAAIFAGVGWGCREPREGRSLDSTNWPEKSRPVLRPQALRSSPIMIGSARFLRAGLGDGSAERKRGIRGRGRLRRRYWQSLRLARQLLVDDGLTSDNALNAL